MNNLNRRIERLESENSARTPDERWVLEFVPNVGESINEFRRRAGMPAMDVPGWNAPTTRNKSLEA